MKFKITKTSDLFNDNIKQRIEEFNSLDELMKFVLKNRSEFVIHYFDKKEIPILEIYDDYRE